MSHLPTHAVPSVSWRFNCPDGHLWRAGDSKLLARLVHSVCHLWLRCYDRVQNAAAAVAVFSL